MAEVVNLYKTLARIDTQVSSHTASHGSQPMDRFTLNPPLQCKQGSYLTALVDRTVTLAPATSYAHLVPILQSLHQAKLPSYPQIGKLVGCVMGNIQQVSLMHAKSHSSMVHLVNLCPASTPFPLT